MASLNSSFFFSLKEWAECPHTFLAAFRYEHDRSWTKLEDVARKDKELKVIDNLLNRGGVPSLEYIATAASVSDTKEGER